MSNHASRRICARHGLSEAQYSMCVRMSAARQTSVAEEVRRMKRSRAQVEKAVASAMAGQKPREKKGE